MGHNMGGYLPAWEPTPEEEDVYWQHRERLYLLELARAATADADRSRRLDAAIVREQLGWLRFVCSHTAASSPSIRSERVEHENVAD